MTSRVNIKVEQLHDGKKILVQTRDKDGQNVTEVGSLEQQGQEVAFHAYEGLEVVIEEVPSNVVKRTLSDTIATDSDLG